jgi:hypothetical protein
VISVIPVDDGSYNLIGTEDDQFVLQGNLTREQLEELREEIEKALT